jgi:hypothetical protein
MFIFMAVSSCVMFFVGVDLVALMPSVVARRSGSHHAPVCGGAATARRFVPSSRKEKPRTWRGSKERNGGAKRPRT